MISLLLEVASREWLSRLITFDSRDSYDHLF